jgi:hypothetical protein
MKRLGDVLGFIGLVAAAFMVTAAAKALGW